MFKLNGEKTCQGISGKRTAFGSGSKTRRRLICDEHAHSTQLTRTVHDLAMDRIFKRTFLMTGAIAQDRQSCQSHFCLMKNPLLYRSAWPESSREASERFFVASACVGKWYSAPQIVWNKSTRRARARRGAGR